jgi:hypothetical protein
MRVVLSKLELATLSGQSMPHRIRDCHPEDAKITAWLIRNLEDSTAMFCQGSYEI